MIFIRFQESIKIKFGALLRKLLLISCGPQLVAKVKNADKDRKGAFEIATGGTMLAAANLIQRSGGQVVETATIIDLPELGGSQKIRDAGYSVFAVCSFNEDE